MNQNSQSLSSAAAEETAIRALYQQLMDGWNAGSGDAFASSFEEDGEWGLMERTSKGAKKLPYFTNTYLMCFSKAPDL